MTHGVVTQIATEPDDVITLTSSWTAGARYDMLALVEHADGRVEHVSTFRAAGTPAAAVTRDGSVTHQGDSEDDPGQWVDSETIQIDVNALDDDVVAVGFVIYSGQSNRKGEFGLNTVSTAISCGQQSFRCESTGEHADPKIFTMAVAIVRFYQDGDITLEVVETYSNLGSEARPTLSRGQFVMDEGPRNIRKRRKKR